MSITTTRRDDGIAVLMLDQPDSRANVLSTQLWNDLDAALQGVSAAAGVIIASAKPGIFIAGADLKLLGEAGPNDPRVRAFIDLGNRVLARLESLPCTTVAAIDGAALGGGLEVALACDLRIVGTNPKVQLGLPETGLGLIPGWGGTQRLPRLVGLAKAAEMLTTGRSLSATDAVAAGLAREQVPSESLIEAAAGHARKPGTEARARKQEPVPEAERQAYSPTLPQEPRAIRTALDVMIQGASKPLAEAIPIETEAFCQLAGTPESKEKIAAFFSRKK